MRATFATLVVLLLSSAAAATTAPDSIAGKVYRETTQVISVRSSSERTIVFQADGRFIYLKAGFGGALILPAPFKIFLGPPHSDGTYTYRRTSDTNATVTLTNDSGPAETISLGFTSPAGGWLGTNSPPTNTDASFTLSDLAEARIAPAVNLSVRGRVEPGRPLIIGFVVPGTPRPATPLLFVPPDGFRQREVLIRVVGPSLASFGVTGTWADPDFQVFKGDTRLDPNEVHYGDWSARPFVTPPVPAINADTQQAFRKIFDYVGAFPLLADSRDAADVLRLDPGAYTIVCTAPNGDVGGDALVEVYFLP